MQEGSHDSVGAMLESMPDDALFSLFVDKPGPRTLLATCASQLFPRRSVVGRLAARWRDGPMLLDDGGLHMYALCEDAIRLRLERVDDRAAARIACCHAAKRRMREMIDEAKHEWNHYDWSDLDAEVCRAGLADDFGVGALRAVASTDGGAFCLSLDVETGKTTRGAPEEDQGDDRRIEASGFFGPQPHPWAKGVRIWWFGPCEEDTIDGCWIYTDVCGSIEDDPAFLFSSSLCY
jgi:hypothetical protein